MRNPPSADMAATSLIPAAWDEWNGELRGFLINQIGASAADDVLQEIFVRLQRSGVSIRNRSSVRAWLYQVARNAMADHGRRHRETTDVSGDLPAEEARPLVSTEARLARCLQPMIESLPAIYADALRVTELGDLTQKQAAHRLGVTLSALKARLRRGRELLRQMLLQCCEFELSTQGHVLDYWPRKGRCECRW